MSRYSVGVDFGTESGRAVLVDVADGRQVATAVSPYRHGVINERLPLPDREVALGVDWALQDPEDYLRVFAEAIPSVLRDAAVDPADVVGVGIDFTACTMLPVAADGTPLCLLPEWRANPHAWVKLWKHHAAQPEADRINEVARATGQPWLDRYGGRISSEWFFSKALQILDEAPAVYAAADRLIEAADWVVWRLTGAETRSACTAGYKAMWSKRDGFPDASYFAALDPPDGGRDRREDEPGRPEHGRTCRRDLRGGGRLDRPPSRDGRRHRQRRCPRGGPRLDRRRGRPDGDDHGNFDLPRRAVSR